LLALKDTLRQAGKHCGIMATSSEDACRRRDQGFRAIGLGMDAGLLLRALHGSLDAVGHDRPLRASLEPVDWPSSPPVLPPESLRPDRAEVLNSVSSGPTLEGSP
jgi:hypothetical protein